MQVSCSLRATSLFFASALGIHGCGGNSPPPPASSTADDAGSRSGERTSGATSVGRSESDSSSAPSTLPDADALPPWDGGTYQGDASAEPIIGVVDPDEVTLVEAEAATPLVAGCPSETAQTTRVAATLPDGAIPLSVTPDGESWAYALPWVQEHDASAATIDLDAGVATDYAEPSFEIHIETSDSHKRFTLPNDQDPTRGAALAADGRHLVTTLSDTKGFVLWQLNETSEMFEPAELQPFVRLNALAANGGVRFEKPVFSTSGTRMYARELQPSSAVVQLVVRDGQWETELRSTQSGLVTQQFYVTAASEDDLTVFGWSATLDQAIAWWRPRSDEPFDTQLVIEGPPIVSVKADCKIWWTLDAANSQ